MKKGLTVVDDAVICGYEGAFCRYIDTDGAETPYGLCNNWYEASALDEEGNEYEVIWEITNEDYLTDEDEGYNCDWDKPYMVVDPNGCNVKDEVIFLN